MVEFLLIINTILRSKVIASLFLLIPEHGITLVFVTVCSKCWSQFIQNVHVIIEIGFYYKYYLMELNVIDPYDGFQCLERS